LTSLGVTALDVDKVGTARPASGAWDLGALQGGTAAAAPASVTATSGTPQSTAVNTSFGTALTATVKDASNNPVNGVTVTFTAPGSGASGTFTGGLTTATATSNSSGVATAPAFAANGMAGSYTVTASVSGVGAPATFNLTNLPAPPAIIMVTGGTSQTATVNT